MKKDRREKRRLESKRLGCACELCKECCEREPGWFMPEEIKSAANLIGVSEDEFLKKYCQEHFEDGVIAMSPARKSGKSACIFLTKEKLCAIHEAKPYECKKVFACQGERRHQKIREAIKRAWRK